MLLTAAARRAAAGRLHLRRGRCSSNMATAASADDWRSNVVASRRDALAIAGAAKTIAVLGIKTERHQGQPAFDVPLVLQREGCRIIPVPVYYPDVTEILGEPVVRNLKAVPAAAARSGGASSASSPARIDILDVFRRSQDVPAHVPDILAMEPRPACVWLQSGCGNAEAEEALARAGIKVVSDRCLKVDRLEARQLGLVGGGGSKL